MNLKVLENLIKNFIQKINIIDESDNYYCKSDGSDDIKHCTILLIDDDNHSNIFISEKKYVYY